MVHCEDHSVVLQKPTTPNIRTTLYPPPTASHISAIVHSMKLNRLLVFLSTGTSYCIYQFEGKETAMLEKIQEQKQMRDCEGKTLMSQKMKCVQLVRVENEEEWIMPLDQEVFNEKLHSEKVKEVVLRDGMQQ